MCARRFACVNRRAHVRGTRVYMNLHNKKHGTYVDSAYTFFQFCPYPEDGLPIHCCSVSYSCDVSLRKLKLENCLCTGYFGSPFLPEREKEKALKSLNFRALLFAFAVRTEDEPYFYSSRTQSLSKLLILSPTNNPTCAIL